MITRLLAVSRRDRMRAIRETAESAALLPALRRVLYTDRDANVRAAAARRLGDLARAIDERACLFTGAPLPPDDDRDLLLHAAATEGWLLDALDDHSPMVRDAIVRALAKCGGEGAVPALRAIVATERMWWLRRSSIYALAAIAGPNELATFTQALGDPFWRVRHAAVKVLVVLGARDPEIRDEVLEAPPSSTLAFLRSSWGPVAVEAPVRAQSASALPPALLDPDPAVVHARLADSREVTPHALVELLCDPHEPLRLLAAERLAAAGDLAAIEAALDWLEEPRIPHVVDTVHTLLDRLGDPAAAIAERALARSDRPGAGRWAISWVVATRSETLIPAALERARRGDTSLRREAIAVVDSDELVDWASSADASCVTAIAIELHARGAFDALARLDGARLPRVRALQIDAAARERRWTLVEAAITHPHHGPRAIAARWLVRGGRVDPSRFATDLDPSVREAALTKRGGSTDDTGPAAARAVRDLDPWVQRAAMRRLLSAYREATVIPDEIVEAVCVAACAEDPVMRQYACRMPGVDDRLLACVLAGLADPDEMVRAGALEGLEYLPEADSRVRAILGTVDPSAPGPSRSLGSPRGSLGPARAMAYGWLVRRLDEPALAFARSAFATEQDASSRRVLAGVLGIELPVEHVIVEPAAPRKPTVVPVVERRPFGRAGFTVAPLAISGAYDLAPRSLDVALDAGVDLYFWEAGYDRMSKFLRTRRPHVRVLTGTYHAEPRAIRRDVESALRVLRRDSLDGFLLFWTRSQARVDGAAYRVLDDLRREGKLRAIGFSTHHRDIARAAIEATPWDVVMIRHSAAHPGIETELLPAARATQTAIVTFSALTYGRMLAGPDAPTASECYRYCLAQSGVTATISAPRAHEELVANLAALAEPAMSAERVAALRAHGTQVRAENQRFNILLRQPTRDAAAAAREMLAAELPPDTEATPRSLPTAGAKRSRTRLGRRRR